MDGDRNPSDISAEPAKPSVAEKVGGGRGTGSLFARAVLFLCLALDALALMANHRRSGLWWPVGLAAGLWAGFLATGTGVVALWRDSVRSYLSRFVWSIGIHWTIAGAWLLAAAVLTFRRGIYLSPFSLTRWLDVLLGLAVILHVAAICRRDSGDSAQTFASGLRPRWLTADWLILAPILTAIWAVWPVGLITGGDACTHVCRLIQLSQNDSIAVCLYTGHAVNPGYAINLWHLILAIVSKLSGIWPAVLWINLFFLVIPLYYVVIHWTVRRLFGSAAGLLTVIVFLVLQLRIAIQPNVMYPAWMSLFACGFTTYAYNGTVLICLLLPLTWMAVVRFDERNDWRYAVLAGGLAFAGLSVHGLGGIFLFGLVVFHFLVGLIWPSAANRRPYLVGLAIATALVLPRVAWTAFSYHEFRRSGGEIAVQLLEDQLIRDWAGWPIERFYFVSCLLLFASGAALWRRRAIRWLALFLSLLFVALLVAPLRNLLSALFSWVFLTRIPFFATYLAWLVIPGALCVIAASLLDKVGLKRIATPLAPVAVTVLLVMAAWIVEGRVPYRQAVQRAFVYPPPRASRRDLQLTAAHAYADLGRQFRGPAECYCFFDTPDDFARLWSLVFGAARTPALKEAQDLLREIIQTANPTAEMVKRLRSFKVRVILTKDSAVAAKIEQLGYQRAGRWEHPQWGEFEMLTWPGDF